MSTISELSESKPKTSTPEPVFKAPQTPLSGPKRKKMASSKETPSSLNEQKIEGLAIAAIAQTSKKEENQMQTPSKKVKHEDCSPPTKIVVSERTGKPFHPDTLKYFEEMKKKLLADMEKRQHDQVARINEKWQKGIQNQIAPASNPLEEKNV